MPNSLSCPINKCQFLYLTCWQMPIFLSCFDMLYLNLNCMKVSLATFHTISKMNLNNKYWVVHSCYVLQTTMLIIIMLYQWCSNCKLAKSGKPWYLGPQVCFKFPYIAIIAWHCFIFIMLCLLVCTLCI